MANSRPPVTPDPNVRARQNRRALEQLQRRGPERWIYVGGGSALCPAWQNSWDHSGSPFAPVGFRFGVHGELEFKGHAEGGTSGAVAFTLPAEYRPDQDVSFLTDVATGGIPTTAQIYITASSGDVTITLL